MVFKYKLEILAIMAIIAYCMIFLHTSSTKNGAEFAGTDTIAAIKMAELSGTSKENINPLIRQWVPPSKEIKSTLFALQTAIGGIFSVASLATGWDKRKKAIDTKRVLNNV
jgi:cobalt/nickel transport protein